jgi:hypothetical protein
MPNDPKWRTIARAAKQTIPVVLAVYVHLLTIASGAVDRGTLVNVNSEDLASALDVDSAAVDEVLKAMQGRVLEGAKLSGWDKRQTNREDGAAERAKAWREAKKEKANAENGSRTQTNADERKRTPDKKREEEINAISKTSSSHPEASLGVVTAIHPDMSIYEAYPRKEGKGAALESIRKAVARLVKGEAPHPPMAKIEAQRYLMRRVLEYERSPIGRQPDKSKIPHPATWFNQKRYDDDQSNWHHTEAVSGKRNHGKTSGNVDAAAQAIALLEARDNQAPDEVCGAPSGPSESFNLADFRGRLIELPVERH